MQAERFALARTWIDVANTDLDAARMLLTNIPSASCFHAQQAAEKALKAALTAVVGDAPRTHKLLDMLDALVSCGVQEEPEVKRACQILERFYAPTRYPDALSGLDPGRVFVEIDARDALGRAEKIIRFCSAVIVTAEQAG
jgi:HEPN domain-containing protein